MSAFSRRALLAAPALAVATRAHAQAPPLTLFVGYAPGGSADLVSRTIGAALGPKLNRNVIVENVTGASGMIAFQRLLASRPDGSAIYFGGLDTLVVPMVNRNVRLDWQRDTIAVTRTTIGSLTFVVPANSPYRDMRGFLEAARRAGDEGIAYGTPGVATPQHFMGEAIGERAGVRLLHVPYRGGNLILNDLLAGNVASAVLVTSTAMPALQQGSLRALAVSAAERVAPLPNVPTLAELPGFEGVAFPLWQGIFARAGSPEPFVAALDTAIQDVVASAPVRAQLAEVGFESAPLGRVEFRAFIVAQGEIYRRLIETKGIRME